MSQLIAKQVVENIEKQPWIPAPSKRHNFDIEKTSLSLGVCFICFIHRMDFSAKFGNESDLVSRLRDGDDVAFAKLYDKSNLELGEVK